MERVLLLQSLRVILWQLPPSLHRDLDRLESFLSMLPKKVGHAVEFRHESWWDDRVAALLRGYNAAFVAVSHPRLPDTLYAAENFLYVRFHGESRHLYRHNYSDDELSRWASILRPHLSVRALYAFFNNDYEANAPRNAMRLREMLHSAERRG